jgi:hypothetical protein
MIVAPNRNFVCPVPDLRLEDRDRRAYAGEVEPVREE